MRKNEPNFNRLKKTLYLEEPDRVPLVELWIDPVIKENFLDKDLAGLKETTWLSSENLEQAQIEVEFYSKAGYDYIPWSPPFNFNLSVASSSGEESPNTEEKYDRNCVPKNVENLTKDNFDTYPWPKLNNVNFSFLNKINQVLPNNMKVIVRIFGILEQVIPLVGWDKFSYLYVHDNEFLDTIIKKVADIQIKAFKKAAKYDSVGAMWFTDDLAYADNLFASVKFYRKHLFPHYYKMSSICNKHELPFIFHSDGTLWKVFDDLADIGFNAIQPIEPKAMDIDEVKRKYGDRFCLIGNLDLNYTLTRGSTEEVKEETKKRIKSLAPGGGYCVGSSNAVTSYVPLENYKTMIDTTLKYGEYPINI